MPNGTFLLHEPSDQPSRIFHYHKAVMVPDVEETKLLKSPNGLIRMVSTSTHTGGWGGTHDHLQVVYCQKGCLHVLTDTIKWTFNIAVNQSNENKCTG